MYIIFLLGCSSSGEKNRIIRSFDSFVIAIDGIVFGFQRILKLGDGFTFESRKSLLTTTW